MKNIILLVVFLIGTDTALADTDQKDIDKAEMNQDICINIAKSGEAIMYARQYTNQTITETNSLINAKTSNSNMRSYYKYLSEQAYEKVKHSLQSAKDKEVSDFASETYLECINTLNK